MEQNTVLLHVFDHFTTNESISSTVFAGEKSTIHEFILDLMQKVMDDPTLWFKNLKDLITIILIGKTGKKAGANVKIETTSLLTLFTSVPLDATVFERNAPVAKILLKPKDLTQKSLISGGSLQDILKKFCSENPDKDLLSSLFTVKEDGTVKIKCAFDISFLIDVPKAEHTAYQHALLSQIALESKLVSNDQVEYRVSLIHAMTVAFLLSKSRVFEAGHLFK